MQKNEYFEHQDGKLYFTTNQFLGLVFFVTYTKEHGACELGKHYHMLFDTKIVHGTCEISFIPC